MTPSAAAPRAAPSGSLNVSQSARDLLDGGEGDIYRRVHGEVDRILSGGWKKGSVPALWDGQAGARIAEIVASR